MPLATVGIWDYSLPYIAADLLGSAEVAALAASFPFSSCVTDSARIGGRRREVIVSIEHFKCLVYGKRVEGDFALL